VPATLGSDDPATGATTRTSGVIRDVLLIVVCLMVTSMLTATGQPASVNELSPAGGVLRWGTASSWRIYDNGHAHSGLARVNCASSGRLVLTLKGESRYVGFGAVTVDETLASKGVTVGVSAGRTALRLFFYRNGRDLRCDSAVFRTPRSNVWVSWYQVRGS
jgi:hypothetical protein